MFNLKLKRDFSMKIKDILIKLKNQSIVESYEEKYDIVYHINELYIEKLIENYSYTKDKLIQEKKNHLLMTKVKKYESRNEPKKIAKRILTFLLFGLFTAVVFSTFGKTGFSLKNISDFFLGFSLYGGVLCGVFYFLKDLILKDKIDNIQNNVFVQSSQYINTHYNSFYNKITFELVEELNSVLEPELQATKDDLKKYLISRAYELVNEESDKKSHSKHNFIRQETTQRMFIDCKKPLENKTIMLEDKSKIQLDEKSMLKSLKLKFGYDKTII